MQLHATSARLGLTMGNSTYVGLRSRLRIEAPGVFTRPAIVPTDQDLIQIGIFTLDGDTGRCSRDVQFGVFPDCVVFPIDTDDCWMRNVTGAGSRMPIGGSR